MQYGTEVVGDNVMAKSGAVWGIDIGQCAIKALRCVPSGDGQGLVADAFDYIEYPKILSQPEADPVGMVRDALKTLLAHNDLRDDKVAISVPGQSGLARFIKLPPVESKKIADIVRYEARQQIPFALDDVIWDYQQMPGGSEEEGFALDTEIGLFAMKRDQVFRTLRPFEELDVELDLVQLTPLSLYNYLSYDVMPDLPPPEEYDPEKPPESYVILSLGTETTDLVITNGYRVWQRSIPLGGNHFTKQLTKELKLTFAKAEHLKRNARDAKDPKKIFQAMRSVFNDLVTEIQRSISFFRSLDRDAKIGRVVALGNAVKLPGLVQYLERNLGLTVTTLESFNRLSGTAVVGAPSFKDNVLSFPTCYGLAIQALGDSSIYTNLLPREIITRRLIRDKKPWAVVTVAAMLAGCMFNFCFHWNAWSQVHEDRYSDVYRDAEVVKNNSSELTQLDTEQETEFDRLKAIGEVVVGNAEGRLLVPELYAAIDAALPDEPDVEQGEISRRPYPERRRIYVEFIDSSYVPELSEWWTVEVQKFYLENFSGQADDADADEEDGEAGAEGEASAAAAGEASAAAAQPVAGASPEFAGGGYGSEEQLVPGPNGPGWVIRIRGHHFFNSDIRNRKAQYVRNTLIKALEDGELELPNGPNRGASTVSMKELGIMFPMLLRSEEDFQNRASVPNPNYDEMAVLAQIEEAQRAVDEGRQPDESAEAIEEEFVLVPKYSFTVQFYWQEKPLSQRLEAQQQKQLEQENATGGNVAARPDVTTGTGGN